MSSALILKALGERIARPSRRWRNRIRAHRARLGGRPEVAGSLPDLVPLGDADLGEVLVAGRWQALGHDVAVGSGSIWQVALPDPRLEAERQACLWLDDLAALGNRRAAALAQGWVLDWLHRYGGGRGPGWQPELAGRRVKRWTAHSQFLTAGLDRGAVDRFWRGMAAQQRYLAAAWPEAPTGMPQLRALAGLVWSGIVLPHADHRLDIASLGQLAEALVDPEGGTPSRAPGELAEILILLVWTARLLEDSGRHAAQTHLAAVVRAVPVVRTLRLGGGGMAVFHGGSRGDLELLDKALAELRLGAQPKPRLAMGYARLGGGRVALVMDGAVPPGGEAATRAHAATLAFEMSVGRQPVVVNAGPAAAFGAPWALAARQTAAASTVEVAGASSSRIEARGLAARTFGARMGPGPSLVSVRQAQDPTGQWLLATHDGYVASHGLLHERRLFVDARGQEVRGEEILSVTDARARAQFDRAAAAGDGIGFAVRFHLHPLVVPELDPARQYVLLTLPSGEVWMFRAAGGSIGLEDAMHFDPREAAPRPARQMVVHAQVVDYLGQVTWSFGRIADAPPAS